MSQQHPARGRGPIAWMANHGVAPNLLMAFLLIGGLIVTLGIRKEYMPFFEADMVTVNVSYPGATPQEMEQGVVLPIENEIAGVDGIKEVTSTANQGSATIMAELESGRNRQQVYQNIQQAVNRISTFPAQIERPIVQIASRSIDVIELTLFGPLDAFAMKRLMEQVKEELLDSKDITKVELRGAPSEEIHIEISQQMLQRHGLLLSDVANIIGNNAIEQSAGTVRTLGGDILVTLNNRAYWAEQFRHVPVISDAGGVLLTLGDIAIIKEGFNDSNNEITFNGQTSLTLRVFRVEDQTPTSVVDAVYKKLDGIRAQLPPGVQLIITDDDGETYRDRVGLLMKNAAIGLLLVIVFLTLFLEYRLAFWVTMGIPIAFMGAMLLLPSFGVTINMFSMFAFIIALGIVVDDTIIVGENIYEHMERGMSPMEASIAGTRQVAVPLAFAILTNIVAFLPILALPGMMGKLFMAVPVVVICCFLVSWIETMFILPTHIGHRKQKAADAKPSVLEKLQGKVTKGMFHFIHHYYMPTLDRCLKAPGLTIAVAAVLGALVLAWAMSGRMGFSMFPRIEGESIAARVELPSNAPLSQAREVRQLVESQLRVVTDAIERHHGPLVVSVQGNISGTLVEVQARLVGSEERDYSANQIVNLWRKQLGEIAGVRSITFDAERGGGPSPGAALTVELRGSNTELLEQASHELGLYMQQLGGVKDVASSFTKGKPQWNVSLTEFGRSLGLDDDMVAQQIRAALYGVRALRQQRERNEVTVLVRLPDYERLYSADIERLLIKTPLGGYIPLVEVADLQREISPATISRRSGKQIVSVTAEVDPREQLPSVMTYLRERVFPDVQAKYPSIDFEFRGRQAETADSMRNLKLYGLLALLIIYVLLAIPFRSYVQPLVIMAAIPFGAVGAILGHMLLGYGLSVMSILGIVALSGVVVNDGLIMVDYANRRRREDGLTVLEAIREAGVRRFRPIILTTVTTFGGLAPMVFEASRQAQFITPMAVSLGFGILFTTFVCLLVIPSLYLLLERDAETATELKTADQPLG